MPVSIPNKSLEVHLPPLNNFSSRATPVNGLWMPKVRLTEIDTRSARIDAIHKAIGWLDVERRPRYTPSEGKTYCNIYAYDLAYLLGGYIPRVWWTAEAMDRLLQGAKVDILYGNTVTELNVNALTDWLLQYGSLFSWKQIPDLTGMQNSVNEGRLGFIVARAKEVERPGHVTAVVPETGSLMANRQNNVVVAPLQSQAGARNAKYFCDPPWWTNAGQFDGFYFWVWEA